MTTFRDVEQLSAYLDDQLNATEAAKLETRLKTDPELAALFQELRQPRALLRQLPRRRAPRNFTLTPKMVGQKPPLPRAYPLFRYASALAALLLFFSFAVNFVTPRMAMQSMPLYGFGGGGGDAAEPELAMEAPAEPVEEPAAPAAPPEEPAAGAPSTPTEDTMRVEPTLEVAAKNGEGEQVPAESGALDEPQPVRPEAPIPVAWQVGLGILALANLIIVVMMHKFAASKWQK